MEVVGSIIEVTHKYTVNGQVNLNFQHYVVGTRSTLTTPEGELFRFKTDYLAVGGPGIVDAIKAFIAPNATYNLTRFQWVFPLRRAYQITTDGAAGTGLSGACTAQNLAAALTRTTDLAGRSQVSTWHQGGIGPSAYTGGTLTPGTITTLANGIATALLQTMTATVGGGVYFPVIWHRNNHTLNQNFNYLAAVETQSTLRVMRRRTVGLGI